MTLIEEGRRLREYRAAGGVVVDEAHQQVLVLVRRDLRAGRPDPEVRLPKGHVEPGETDEEAAQREVCEEAGLCQVDLLADLGRQTVEFDSLDAHVRRNERYFLMRLPCGAVPVPPEVQFERLWVTWHEALEALTYEPEREWVRRARLAAQA